MNLVERTTQHVLPKKLASTGMSDTWSDWKIPSVREEMDPPMCLMLAVGEEGTVKEIEGKETTVAEVDLDGMFRPRTEARQKLDTTPKEVVVRQHWDRFVELLYGGEPESRVLTDTSQGYQHLLSYKSRLEERAKEASKELSERQVPVSTLQMLFRGYAQSFKRLTSTSLEVPIASVKDSEALSFAAWEEHRLDVGDIFDDARFAQQKVSDLDPSNAAERWEGVADKNGRFQYLKPLPQELVRRGISVGCITTTLRSFKSDYRVVYLCQGEKLVGLSSTTTWRELFRDLWSAWQRRKALADEIRRKFEVLQFQLNVLRNVLYRFETFGSVDELSAGEAEALGKATREKLKAVVKAGDEVLDEKGTSGRMEVCRRAVQKLGLRGENTPKQLLNQLQREGYAPKQESVGRPSNDESAELTKNMISRCKAHLHTSAASDDRMNDS